MGRNSWIPFLSTPEGAEAVGAVAGQLGKKCGALTRASVKGATVGCRWWQLLYAILVSLPFEPSVLLEWKKGVHEQRGEYAALLEQGKAIIRQVERDRTSSLYRILYQNEAVMCDESKEAKEPCLRPLKADWMNHKRYYLCTHRGGIIGHYFVLEKAGRSWYILSSYGSEWVRVPFRLSRVSVEEIEAFLASVGMTTEQEKATVGAFFSRYFLEGGLSQRYSEDESEALVGRIIPPSVGIQKEWDIVGRTGFEVSVIDGMEEEIRVLGRRDGGGQSTRRRKMRGSNPSRSRRRRSRSGRGVETRRRKGGQRR